MHGSYRIAPLLIAGLLLVLGLWFTLRAPGSAPVAPAGVGSASGPPARAAPDLRAPVPEPEARVAVPELESPGTIAAAEVGVAVPDGLRVRSSSGLALPFVDWRTTGGAWTRVALWDGGRLPVPLPAPCDVRASGHRSAVFEAGSTEIVLEPDALLLLRAPHLRRCVQELEIEDPFLERGRAGSAEDVRRPEVAVWGFLSDSEWAVAVSAEAVLREFGLDGLSVSVFMRDGRRFGVAFHATSGNAGTWNVPCEDLLPASPLAMVVARLPTASRRAVRIQLSGPDIYRDGSKEFLPWGIVWHMPLESWHEIRELSLEQDRIEFPVAPLGMEITAVAQDLESYAYGRTVFVHDGTPRYVELLPPLRVGGRLVDRLEGTPVARAALYWQCRVEGQAVFGWHAQAHDAELGADGSFLLAGPMTAPGASSMPLEPPGKLWLRVEAAGYRVLELERELNGVRELDVGELLLERRVPELVLAAGHGLTPRQIAWMRFEIAGQPGRSWEVRWGRLAADGSLELHFADPETGKERPSEPPPDWSTAQALILYAQDDRIPVRAFERDPDGRYAAVEMRRHEIEFAVEPSASDLIWSIGWEWRGLFAVCTGVTRPAAGETVRVTLHAPADGARLAWVGRERGEHRGPRPSDVVPLADAMPALVLR